MTWHIVVRHFSNDPNALATQNVRCDCDACRGWVKSDYPKTGFPITAFADRDQAERFAQASTTQKDRYEVVEVVPKS